MVLFYPFRYRFEFDHDEGINAIKAMLELQGYPLYSETWSDQPPIFTMLLKLWFHIFGQTVLAGRGLVLLLSAGLLWLVIQYLRQFYGNLHALFGVILLLLLPYYLRLSVSIMIGLPAISLALLSFFGLTQWHRNKSPLWLVLSGSALSLSIMTKLFTAFLAPIFFIGITLSALISYREQKERLRALKPLLIWFAALTITTGVVAVLFVKPEYIQQMLQIHVTAAGSTSFSQYREYKFLKFILELLESLPILFLVPISVVSMYRSRSWSMGYLIAWVVLGTILLLINTPFWYHHQLLVTIPSAILAAIVAGDGLIALREVTKRRKATAASIGPGLISWILVMIFIAIRLPSTFDELDYQIPNFRPLSTEDFAEYQIVATMWNFKDHTNWIYTDRLMFAFRTQFPVPPHLAVISRKRMAAGALTEDQIWDILVEYQPEQVFQERLDLPVVRNYMSKMDFRRVDETRKFRLFVRNDVIQASGEYYDSFDED